MLTPGSIILDGKFEIPEEVKKTESTYGTGVIEAFRLTPASRTVLVERGPGTRGCL